MKYYIFLSVHDSLPQFTEPLLRTQIIGALNFHLKLHIYPNKDPLYEYKSSIKFLAISCLLFSG